MRTILLKWIFKWFYFVVNFFVYRNCTKKKKGISRRSSRLLSTILFLNTRPLLTRARTKQLCGVTTNVGTRALTEACAKLQNTTVYVTETGGSVNLNIPLFRALSETSPADTVISPRLKGIYFIHGSWLFCARALLSR